MKPWHFTDYRKAERARKQAVKQKRQRLSKAAPELYAACKAVYDCQPNARAMVCAVIEQLEEPK